MRPPYFRPGEEVSIGPYSHDVRLTGQLATIVQLLQPMFDEHRYAAIVRGRRRIFLEKTLQKRFQAGCWSDCPWQPRRVR